MPIEVSALVLPRTGGPVDRMDDSQAIRAILARLGSAPREPLPLGNKASPYDEIVYILLTVMTRSQPRIDRAFEALYRETEGDWGRLLAMDRSDIDDILTPLGFVNRRSQQLLDLVARIEDEHGGSLEFLEELPDTEALEFLMSLPGVGTKSAKCVLMYSLGRAVLPVDVHVLRVAKRLGLLEMDMSWAQADAALETMVPADLKYDTHVQFVIHGRDVCKSRGARCDACVLLDICPSGPLPPDRRSDYV